MQEEFKNTEYALTIKTETRQEIQEILAINEALCAIHDIKDEVKRLEKWGEYKHDETYKVVSDLQDFIYEAIRDIPLGNFF